MRTANVGRRGHGVLARCLALSVAVASVVHVMPLFHRSLSHDAFVLNTAYARLAEAREAIRLRYSNTASQDGEMSKALVRITKENAATAAGIFGGMAGFFVAGAVLGLPLFCAFSYVARKEDDSLAKVVVGAASGGLGAINYGATAISDAIEKAKLDPETQEVMVPIANLASGASRFNEEVGITDAVGALVTESSKLAGRTAEKTADIFGAQLSQVFTGVEKGISDNWDAIEKKRPTEPEYLEGS